MDVVMWVRAQWDRVLGIALIILGGVFLLLGWIGVSGSPYVADELAYIVSGGLGGLFLLGIGCTLLILATLGDEWRKLDQLEQLLVQALDRAENQETNLGGREFIDAAAIVAERPSPRRRARRASVVGGVGGVLSAGMLALAWATASGTGDVQEAVDAVSAGAVAITAQMVTFGAVVVPERRALSRRVVSLFSPLAISLLLEQRRSSRASEPTERTSNDRVAVIAGLTLYHRADCAATRGQQVQLVPLQKVGAGRRPCQLCKAP